jgi:hypothetical protein
VKKNNWKEEWINMPEYSNEEIKPYMSIKVHFVTKEDYEEFAELVKQNLTDKTKSIWYPKKIKGKTACWRYIDEEESSES